MSPRDCNSLRHSISSVHAQIKPSMLLVREEKTLLIAELWLANVAEKPLTTRGVVGSPSSASPEIRRETAITAAADVFSLGISVRMGGRLSPVCESQGAVATDQPS